MTRVVGIICEYNPFHNGHKYQIDKIKSIEKDATIIAVMSGNIVQRGEFAVIDKQKRAEIALENGVNAVFELPYPYAGSTAEIFANAGVEIVSKLGCDCLYFGVEEHSVKELEKIAEIVDSVEFENEFKNHIAEKGNGFITAKELTLKKFGVNLPKSANDMLAVEYIRAIKKKGLNLEYCAVQRIGSRYNDCSLGKIMSASGIRRHFYQNSQFLSVPAKPYYDDIISQGKYLNEEAVKRYLHSFVLLNFGKKQSVFDASLEMLSLIYDKAKNCHNGAEFADNLSSKYYTSARMKRAVLYSLFGVKKVDFTPKYTFLLGMDSKGRKHINKVKKNKGFAIITKHSDGKNLSIKSKQQIETSYLVDALYNTFLEKPIPPSKAYKIKPIVKE